MTELSLFSILFHHQTTTIDIQQHLVTGCLVSYFITKPQLLPVFVYCEEVVQYLISSPNHNLDGSQLKVVLLFSILFHHQTTTIGENHRIIAALFSILFHHQTTTATVISEMECSCLVSYFITKPQHRRVPRDGGGVVQYLISSPNHNLMVTTHPSLPLFSILFHHQTTTAIDTLRTECSCLVSYFITKPQQGRGRRGQG